MREYSSEFPAPSLIPETAPRLSGEHAAIEAAIARGSATGRKLVSARDALFQPMRDILLIAGRDGLMASILGVYLAVTSEPASGAVVRFPGEGGGE